MKLSIILPTLHRPNQLVRALHNIRTTTLGHDVETIVIVDRDDLETKLVLKGIEDLPIKANWIVVEGSPTAIEKWNLGAKVSTGDWLMIGSDDYIMPFDWLKVIKETENKGFIAISDQNNIPNKPFEPFYMASRDWLKKYQGGVLAVPHYKAWGIDLEIAFRAKRAGHYIKAATSFMHFHPELHTGLSDGTYSRAKIYYHQDLELFSKRKALDFPNDFEGYL